MSTVALNFPSSISTDDVKKTFATVNHLLTIGSTLATLTPGHVDDNVIAFLKGLSATVEPLAEQDWFPEFVNLLLSLLKKNPQAALAALKAAHAA
jgi:hypothetical protein